jgi:hypothetical protein
MTKHTKSIPCCHASNYFQVTKDADPYYSKSVVEG